MLIRIGKNWKSLDYGSDFGLNWKSLTQPAILPINTDYLPKVSDFKTVYEMQSYYQLLVDKYSNSGFLSPKALICELICQRLTQVRVPSSANSFNINPFIFIGTGVPDH